MVELPAARVEQITARFDAFAKAIREDGAPPDFEITAEELNGLINENKDLAGKVFLRIEDGRVGGDLSLPMDELPGGGGRFLNASVDFEVAMRNGALTVTLADAKVNGSPLPPWMLGTLAGQNLAVKINRDPKFAKVLSRFESLEVVGDKIILRPRRDLPAAGDTDGKGDSEVKGEIETFDDDTAPVSN
ncbi:hypothetical protein Pla108_16210 [Botrimarina colliarenosi]|uniref:Uncharacterized protein n=1 Tax=Botrimarina colliarenosi TaxID=2528001 RepID=A0A5C6AN31_9BACT|nr:hypothetical protein [Botrimarina colliarenosi]TWU00669.1 hypothetical protein Pla108_16210 [Botrimarina colliarenosi]